jgi:hypothetical protein
MAEAKRAARRRRGPRRARYDPLALVAACLWPSSVRAGDPPAPRDAATVAACVSAHTSVQELRKKHLLLQAREALKGCMLPQCPALVQSDCYTWTDDLEKETPSVIFNVTSQGAPVVDPHVSVDGAPVELSTTGTPLRLDPGHHAYRVEHAGQETARDLVLFAGQRFMQINVELEPPAAPGAPSTRAPNPLTESYRPVPAVGYVFLALGIAGAASFAGFGIAGLNAQHSLDSSCSPRCTDGQVSGSGVQTKYLVADVSAGVGAAGLVAFGLAVLLRPTKERPVTAVVVPGPTGVFGSLMWRGM